MNKKGFARYHSMSGFAPVLIVVIIATLTVAGYFVLRSAISPTELTLRPNTVETITPTTDPTADWKTYTNEKYLYSIRYPSNFTINSLEQTPGQEDIVRLEESKNGNKTEISMNVSDREISKELYLTYRARYEQLIQNNEPLASEFNNVSGEYKKLLIEGFEAYQLTVSSDVSTVSNVSFEKDGLIFTIQLLTDGPYDLEVFNQILSTFEFIE